MKLLLQRRWRRGIALTLVVSAVCVLLGLWQLDRRQTKLERIHAVTAHYDDAPVALSALLPTTTSALPAGTEWSPVEVRGEYLPQETLLVRNRPSALRDVAYGYLVLVPLRVDPADGGGVLLVDRGWIPAGESGAEPDAVPAPPAGEVTVVARLRPPEARDPRDRSAPTGQVQRVDLTGEVPRALSVVAPSGATTAAALHTGAYGWLASEDPAPPASAGSIERPQEPELDEGPHLGYSLQWFVFALGVWGFLVVHVRRAAADEAADATRSGGGAPAGVPPAPPAGAAAASGGTAHGEGTREDDSTRPVPDVLEARPPARSEPGPGPRPARRRRRPSDEELEDAALDAAEDHRVP